VVQWLLSSETPAALHTFYTDLHRCLASGARAVLQVYPDGPYQVRAVIL
jgi:hypothetical protein